MSELFQVEVDHIRGTRVALTLVTIHPDAGPLAADAGFALRLLHDTAFELDEYLGYHGTCPLGEAMTFDQGQGAGWMRENASRFIASVTVEPPGLPDEVPTGTEARYEIEVTDAKWLEHLSKGQTWTSAAYS
jgi:hypothetical protein